MVKPRFTIDVQTFTNLLLLVVPGGAVYFWTRGDQLDEEAMAAKMTKEHGHCTVLYQVRIQVPRYCTAWCSTTGMIHFPWIRLASLDLFVVLKPRPAEARVRAGVGVPARRPHPGRPRPGRPQWRRRLVDRGVVGGGGGVGCVVVVRV